MNATVLQEVREAAVSLLERAVKRHTCLAPLVLPPLLAALAKLPPAAAVSLPGRDRGRASVRAAALRRSARCQPGATASLLGPAGWGGARAVHGGLPAAAAWALKQPPLLVAPLPPSPQGEWGATAEAMLPALQAALAGAGAAAAAAADEPEPEAEQAQVGAGRNAALRPSGWLVRAPCSTCAVCGATAAVPTNTPLASNRQAVGACRVLEGRAVWRYINRDWAASRALMLALLASGGCCAKGRRRAVHAARIAPACRAHTAWPAAARVLACRACPLAHWPAAPAPLLVRSRRSRPHGRGGAGRHLAPRSDRRLCTA